MNELPDTTKEFGKLTPREQKFFMAFLETGELKAAYLAIRPNVKGNSAGRSGWRMMQHIKEKVNWERLLDYAGLGKERVIQGIHDGLNSEAQYRRQRALELLAKLHGMGETPAEHIGDVNITNITVNQWVEIKEIIFRVLEKHPDAKADLIEALKGLDEVSNN